MTDPKHTENEMVKNECGKILAVESQNNNERLLHTVKGELWKYLAYIVPNRYSEIKREHSINEFFASAFAE